MLAGKPGRYRGVIGRQPLPFGKRGQTCGGQRSDVPISQFQLSAFVLASQLCSQDFTAKLFCNVESWIERLPKLIGFCESACNCNSEFLA